MAGAKEKINILAISGSLRTGSSNEAVINAAAQMTGPDVYFHTYDALGTLPHFDDNKTPAQSVLDFRHLLQEADALLICSPEYAFGVPGSLKNAIDWTVSSGEFVHKPTALITAATGGDKAHASLLLTLTALSANVPEDGALLLSFIRSKMNSKGDITDTETLERINKVITALIVTARAEKVNL